MFRIRRILDDTAPANRRVLERVRRLLAERFDELTPAQVDRVPRMLRNPFRHGFRSLIFVAEQGPTRVRGFAALSHDPRLDLCFLDYLAADKTLRGRGIGGALYERVREEALLLDGTGIFFECLPDDPALCRNPVILKQNAARLRFYEAYGARPVVNTKYETPVKLDEDNAPYLVFDDLGRGRPLPREYAKKVVGAILTRKYKDVCSPEYVRTVVESFVDDPVRLRPPRYVRKGKEVVAVGPASDLRKIALVVNDRHAIHHVRERGYVESPVRVKAILDKLLPTNLFRPTPVEEFPERHILEIHGRAFYTYLKRACAALEKDKSLYPYVFPIRNASRPPRDMAVRAGYYCIDTFTPLSGNAFLAAKRAVDCAMTAAARILEGGRLAYALVRPPGHHAETNAFGGFCYFNNAAVAAHRLSRFGRVAMLDIDYHHGNGQQTIFYRRRDVLTVSIHGEPGTAYPYFSGFRSERGKGRGRGFNRNHPLPENASTALYLRTLDSALAEVRQFRPDYLVVCLGLDTAKGDPTGTWMLTGAEFREIGKGIGALDYPTLVVQEGGYRTRSIGANAREFFTGLWEGAYRRKPG